MELVPLGRLAPLCLPRFLLFRSLGFAVDEGLGANILQGRLQRLGTVKERIERIDMRADGSRQGRICGLVLGRVAEKLLPSQDVVIDRPIRVSRRGGHGELSQVVLAGRSEKGEKKFD